MTPQPVVFVSGHDPTRGIGGHSRFVRTHARAALCAGFAPHVFCVAPRSATVRTDYGTVHRVASPFRPLRHLMVPFHGPFLARAVATFLQTEPRAKVIHGFFVWGWVGAEVASWGGSRSVISLVSTYDALVNEQRAMRRGLESRHGIARKLVLDAELGWCRLVAERYEARGYRAARAVFVNYEVTARMLRGRFGENVPVRLMPYTSETAMMAQAHEPLSPAISNLRAPGVPLIVSASRHDPRKGISVLLRALALLVGEGVSFRACLVGGGDLLDVHRALAHELGLDGIVSVPGFVPESYDYVREADIFVLPSLEEGSGSMSLLEALQAGVAAVSTNIDGIPEDVTDGDSALLVPPGDSFALAAALRRLIEDSALRARLAARGHSTYEKRFMPSVLIDALRDAYRTVDTAAP